MPCFFRVERDLGRHLVLSQTQNKRDLLYFTQLQDTVVQIESFYPCIQLPRNSEVARGGVLGCPSPAPHPFVSIFLKVVWYPKMDQKICLNRLKKDQLCGSALKKWNWIWIFNSKWLLWKPTTASWGSVLQHWRQHFLLFYKTRFDRQISISCKFLFCSVQWT